MTHASRLPAPLSPQVALAWSATRHRLLSECERAVYWQVFGCRGLGLPVDDLDAARDARRAWALRHLTDLPRLVGTLVHAAARTVLDALATGGRLPAYSALLGAARAGMNQAWRASQPDAIGFFWRYPTAVTALRELAVRGSLREVEIARARGRIRGCLAALLGAPVLDDVRAAVAAGRDALWLPPSGPEQFAPFEGAMAWAAVDFAYRHANVRGVAEALWATAHDATAEATRDVSVWRRGAADRQAARAALARMPKSAVWCVADVKTAACPDPDGEALQLGGYGLWLRASGFAPTDGVFLGRIVDLIRQVDRWYVLDEAALDAARAVIAADLERQRRLMADAERGVPLPRDGWALAVDPRSCGRCRFRPLCPEHPGGAAVRRPHAADLPPESGTGR